MSLPLRTPQEVAIIDAMSNKLAEFWAAADDILQWDGAYPPAQEPAARSALDAKRTSLLTAINSALFAPGSDKSAITCRIATVTELSVASLEGADLQTPLSLPSRDVARQTMAEAYALVSAAACGRLPLA